MNATQKVFRNGAKKLCTASLAAALAAGMLLTGCSGQASNTNANTESNTNNTAEATTNSESSATTATVKDIDLSALDLDYTDRDKDASYDESSAVKISLTGTSATVEGSSDGVTVDGSTVTSFRRARTA